MKLMRLSLLKWILVLTHMVNSDIFIKHYIENYITWTTSQYLIKIIFAYRENVYKYKNSLNDKQFKTN